METSLEGAAARNEIAVNMYHLRNVEDVQAAPLLSQQHGSESVEYNTDTSTSAHLDARSHLPQSDPDQVTN